MKDQVIMFMTGRMPTPNLFGRQASVVFFEVYF